MYGVSDFRRGLKIQVGETPYNIIEFQHVKPGKGNAFTRTKLRDLLTGRVQEVTFRSGEKVIKPDLFESTMQYLYQDGEDFVLMDSTSYDQLSVTSETMGDSSNYLLEGMNVSVLRFDGRVIGVELPNFVNLTISKCDPAVKGDTVTGATKPAHLETGAQVHVPLFINEGDKVRVDTRSGEYMERVRE
ncbi:MAG TPA: elongation factor P [Myxococcales bacterium]|jgi:elongation factor P|nr:elongation factor P [Myxococcales bacterium]MBF93798.1 elongation factor P [Myxococcales bacterium]HBU49256.1 elongation factor P [Myxococcales bacterium]|tara:strand:- start:1742 stop:2305 length:564 start_codon:yes stop_codon:yes gene_type:complete